VKPLAVEEKIIKWMRLHSFHIACIIVTALALFIRFNVLDFESPDMKVFLLPWFNEMIDGGGVHALNQQVGNYGIPYQTLIAVLTYLPISPVHGYKLYSIICDFGLAVSINYIVRRLTGSKEIGLISYNIIIIHPIVFLNSSVWGQCDSIFTLFCILSLSCLLEEKNTATFVFLGVAFAFKLQAIFALPFFLIIYVCKTKFSILNILWIPICMVILSLGGIIKGRSIGDVFQLYVTQVGTYKRVSNNYPSLWNLLVDNFTFNHYQILSPLCIAITIVALGILMLYLLYNNNELNKKTITYLAFLSTYITVFFLPSMHERYSYIYIVMGLTIACIDKRTIPAYIGLVLVDCQTYSQYLFNVTPIPWMVLVTLNIVCMIWYCYRFVQMYSYRSTVERKIISD